MEFLSWPESSIQEGGVVNLSSPAHFSGPALENDGISRSRANLADFFFLGGGNNVNITATVRCI